MLANKGDMVGGGGHGEGRIFLGARKIVGISERSPV